MKPENCEQRLLQVLRLGGQGDTVADSYAVWERLAAELAALPVPAAAEPKNDK